jgi:XTP/dITP diphosphohydrolase
LSGDVLLIATRSKGKLVELRPLLSPLGRKLLTLDDAGIPETPDEDQLECFETFEENSLAKARYFAERSGLATVADDSGLEVNALGGRPGVHSKRWSGSPSTKDEELYELNRAKLLAELGSARDRSARFVCVAAYTEGGNVIVERGETEGVILTSARGGGGFGYDPLFLATDLGRTLAECTVAEKQSVSHRGRAFTALVARLLAK